MAGTSPAMTQNKWFDETGTRSSVDRALIHDNSLPSSREKKAAAGWSSQGRNKMSISIAAMFRRGLLASAILAGLGLTSPALAQSTVYIPAILQLSRAGAGAATNFRNGLLPPI